MHQGKPVLPVTQQSPPEMLLLGNKTGRVARAKSAPALLTITIARYH